MKQLLLVILTGFSLVACSQEKKAANPSLKVVDVTNETKITKLDTDSIQTFSQKKYSVTEIPSGQQIIATWDVVAMRTIPTAQPDSLKNVVLKFTEYATIWGQSPCQVIQGLYKAKSREIDISYEDGSGKPAANGCNKSALDAQYMNVLENKVRNFKVQGNLLFLMDEAGNTVLYCKKSANQ